MMTADSEETRDEPVRPVIDDEVRSDHVVVNRPVYIAMAIDVDGAKHVLGIWLGKGDRRRQILAGDSHRTQKPGSHRRVGRLLRRSHLKNCCLRLDTLISGTTRSRL